ncbi:MAG: precorrin-3B C(17)-methyltransferase [Eggerthellaceae bacterium]|nr:precorrin-3B C(17)-methyltransferase [Eggerthellaceae bacterium]
MKAIAFIAFTQAGCALAVDISQRLATLPEYAHASFSVAGPQRYAKEMDVDAYQDLSTWTAEHFAADDALVFVGASGIAVRAIAPHVQDKFTDPAVVSVDEEGRFAVPLLSGHVGGANDLARAIADVLGAQAAVSTATDVNGLFAVDEWAARHGLAIVERDVAKEISAALLEGRAVGYEIDFDIEDQPQGVAKGKGTADIGFVVSLDEAVQPFARTLHLVPRTATVGVGCRKGTDPAVLRRAVFDALAEARVSPHAVTTLASIDVKSDEPAIIQLAQGEDWNLAFYSADELASISGEFSHSDFVERTVGVGNVCERAACAQGGTLVTHKQSGDGVTVAIALTSPQASGEENIMGEGKLLVVGLGPGGADDMSGRARKAIQSCDLIVGYTVYIDLLKSEFPDKDVLTTPMRKEVERCRAALDQAAAGRSVAMVCSGDPGVYGMAGLIFELASEYPPVEIGIVPGISAANGGAAVLGAPLMHDFCVISLSDLLTPWETIDKRLAAAAEADFVISLYNPSSHKRPDYLQRACDILLQHKDPSTVCGTVRNIGREGEEAHVLTLGELRDTPVDMFTTVFVGNSQTMCIDGRMVTPRGYLQREDEP